MEELSSDVIEYFILSQFAKNKVGEHIFRLWQIFVFNFHTLFDEAVNGLQSIISDLVSNLNFRSYNHIIPYSYITGKSKMTRL